MSTGLTFVERAEPLQGCTADVSTESGRSDLLAKVTSCTGDRQTRVRFVNGQSHVIVQVQDVFGSKLDVLGMCHIAKLRSSCPQPHHAAAPFT